MKYRTALLGLGVALLLLFVGVESVFAQTSTTGFSFIPASGVQFVLGNPNNAAYLNLQLASGVRVTGVDVQLSYDPTIIQVLPIGFVSSPIFTNNVILTPNPTGLVKYSSTLTQAGTFLTGPLANPSYVQINFIGLKVGTTTLRFVCSQGMTNDTNIVQYPTGTDIVNCASLPSLTVTVTAPTPTPTPLPTPTPTPVIPVCLTISSDVASPVYGQSVRFTCGQVAGATSYAFRYRLQGTADAGVITPLAAGSNISQPFTYTKAGTYDFECQACIGASCSPYTAW